MAQPATITSARASLLLLRLQWLRLTRQLSGAFRWSKKREGIPKRAATAGKSRQSIVIASLLALTLAFSFTNLAYQAVTNIKQTVGWITVPVDPARLQTPAPSARPGAVIKQKQAAE